MFTSFDEAWAWFSGGGALEPAEDRRDRFTRGRAQFLSFQAPVSGSLPLDLIDSLQDALAEVEGILLQPRELLHVSVRGIGFQVLKKQHHDEVTREDAGRIGEQAAVILRGAGRIDATIGPLNVFPDAVILELHDHGALAAIRGALAGAVAHDSLVDDAHYLPHCTVATFASASAADALRAIAMGLRDRGAAPLSIGRVELTRWWFTGVDDREDVEVETIRSYRLR